MGVGLVGVGFWLKILVIFRRIILIENNFSLFTSIYNLDISIKRTEMQLYIYISILSLFLE